MIRIASYNVENLFARPKAFDGSDWSIGEPILAAYEEVNRLFQKPFYDDADKVRITALLITLDIYSINANGVARRKRSSNPRWAWLRKNRGSFDREPRDNTQSVVIIATVRDDWIGLVELAVQPFKETRTGFPIRRITSNVDLEDNVGEVLSRDCPQFEVATPTGETIHILVNHFKTQSGGGGSKRERQAMAVRTIVDRLTSTGEHVVVMGDLNEGPRNVDSTVENFSALYTNNSPLADCYSLPQFDTGPRPGTYNSCGIRNRLDYIFVSESLTNTVVSGGVFRKGLWGTRKSRPDNWETYQEMNRSEEQASDHAAVFIDLDM